MKKIVDNRLIPEILSILKNMHPDAMCALDHVNNYELLVAVILSAQTTDVSVNKVTPVLFEKYPDPQSLADADPAEVEQIIKTIGLYKNKTANIVKMAKRLTAVYGGEVPGNYEDLISLPGVGRKTANVVLAEGFGIPRIAVDTHVFRVSNRIGLTDEQDVTKTEQALMERIPQNDWISAHHLLIFHGRRICSSRRPKCSVCGLNNICIYAERGDCNGFDDGN